jgi:hypothetical protein
MTVNWCEIDSNPDFTIDRLRFNLGSASRQVIDGAFEIDVTNLQVAGNQTKREALESACQRLIDIEVRRNTLEADDSDRLADPDRHEAFWAGNNIVYRQSTVIVIDRSVYNPDLGLPADEHFLVSFNQIRGQR